MTIKTPYISDYASLGQAEQCLSQTGADADKAKDNKPIESMYAFFREKRAATFGFSLELVPLHCSCSCLSQPLRTENCSSYKHVR